ncbi:MAG: hypothetical protein AB7G88_04755 [Thermomicrobiales bacterium]
MGVFSNIRTRIAALFGTGAACARLCEQLYPRGDQRTQCVRDGAAHKQGNLCDACDGDISRICTRPDGRHVCCRPMQVCDKSRGVCV